MNNLQLILNIAGLAFCYTGCPPPPPFPKNSLKNEMKFIKWLFFLFLSITLYTFVYIDRSNIFICLLFCSLSTGRYLCYDNDITVKDCAGQEKQAIEFSDFPLRNNPNTVILPNNICLSVLFLSCSLHLQIVQKDNWHLSILYFSKTVALP